MVDWIRVKSHDLLPAWRSNSHHGERDSFPVKVAHSKPKKPLLSNGEDRPKRIGSDNTVTNAEGDRDNDGKTFAFHIQDVMSKCGQSHHFNKRNLCGRTVLFIKYNMVTKNPLLELF